MTVRRRAIALALALPLVFVMAGPAAARGGGTAKLVTSPTSINFGRIPVGQSSSDYVGTKAVYITNNTRLPLYLTNLGVEGGNTVDTGVDFILDAGTTSDCSDYVIYGNLLNPGESCATIVVFSPDEAGLHTAYLVTGLTDGVNSYTSAVSLRGRGTSN